VILVCLVTHTLDERQTGKCMSDICTFSTSRWWQHCSVDSPWRQCCVWHRRPILLERFSLSFGLSDCALEWFRSYITGWTQSLRIGANQSSKIVVCFGVAHGSVLGPLLYVLYTADLILLIQSCGLQLHQYADDTQLYGFCSPQESISLSHRVMVTIGSTTETWTASNRLRLNQQKTNFLWCGTRNKLAAPDLNQLAAISSALIWHSSVWDLGVILDSELSFEQHASKLTQTCFFHLSRHRAIRRSLTNAALLYSGSRIYCDQTWLLQLGSVRLQNVCRSSPTVDTELLSSADAKHSQVWANDYSHVWYATLVTCAPAHHVRDLYTRLQLCQWVSTDMFTGDLQFSQRRCTSTATSLYWPWRPGRAARQHWQIRSARLFCVRAEPVEQAATWRSESVR